MTARDVVAEFGRRLAAGDDAAFDLVAVDMVNHAAGPQGREGYRRILATLRQDFADLSFEDHGLLADGDRVATQAVVRGRHVGSTMPLLQGVPVTGRRVEWAFFHVWRVADGLIAEHWACRDDLGLLRQLGAWPPAGRV